MVYRHDAPEQKSLGDNVVPADPFHRVSTLLMLLANSAVISEAAGVPAWKHTSEPNSWRFGDLWSAFPEFANSIVLWRLLSKGAP
jgi:hypothetical protein